ncbi:hypothetical protein TWF694_006668 [Orbilia ellipsospora]|uniref:Uncharacterized protein n=1 Tax=Orbilia ellipsospora TaxID=2528407 RepID=A0AAV9XKW3_9PEZI
MVQWDGTIPEAGKTYNYHHWLFPNRNRPRVTQPNDRWANDPESDGEAYPYAYPLAVLQKRRDFQKTYQPNELHTTIYGTTVIPRSEREADLVILVTITDNDILPPSGADRLAARFLVCSRKTRYMIPFFQDQFAHQGRLPYCQQLGEPIPGQTDDKTDVKGVFMWKLPKADMTALWIILTMIHGRWPEEWSKMDIPLDTLYEIARLTQILNISKQSSNAWELIRGRLDYTLPRQRMEVGRPQDRNVAKWLFIAKVFEYEEEFTALWANLVVSTYKFEMDSMAVDRYSNGAEGDPRPEMTYNWWYTIDDLGEDMKENLRDDRYIVLYDLRLLWADFRSRYRLPTQREGTLEEIMAAVEKYQLSCQNLREEIITYANEIMEQQKRVAILSNRDLNPMALADCQALIRKVNAVFNQINSRDVDGTRVVVASEDYWRPLAYEDPQIETPIELDGFFGLKKTIFTFQSGWSDSMVYWRNKGPEDLAPGLPLFNTTKLWLSVLIIIWMEYSLWWLQKQELTKLEPRFSVYILLFVTWRWHDDITDVAAKAARKLRMTYNKRAKKIEAYNRWRVLKWQQGISINDSTSTDLKPPMPDDYRDLTRGIDEAEKFELTSPENVPENLYLETRLRLQLMKFRSERKKRQAREKRDEERLIGQELWRELLRPTNILAGPVGGAMHRMLRVGLRAAFGKRGRTEYM